MVPHKRPLQHKEQHDAGEDVRAVPQRPFSLHYFRKDVNKHVAEQGPGGEAHEIKKGALETFFPDC